MGTTIIKGRLLLKIVQKNTFYKTILNGVDQGMVSAPVFTNNFYYFGLIKMYIRVIYHCVVILMLKREIKVLTHLCCHYVRFWTAPY